MPFKKTYTSLKERLYWNCEIVGECWLWQRAKQADGYARINIRINGKIKSFLAHRIAYEEYVGQIPAEHDLDHRSSCPRHCINPEHLTPVPYKEHRRKTGWPLANPAK